MFALKQFRFFFIISIFGSLGGCAVSGPPIPPIYQAPVSLATPAEPKVLVFPAKVVVIRNKAFSETSPSVEDELVLRKRLDFSLEEYFFENGVEVIPYKDKEVADEHLYLVNQAAIIVDAAEQVRLGNIAAGTRFYGLGKGSVLELDEYNADYLLLRELKEIVPPAGLALFSDRMPERDYRMSLFDLRDGQLIWSYGSSSIGNYDDPRRPYFRYEAPLYPVGKRSYADVEENGRLWEKVWNRMMVNFPL
ncbi:hypothetical protein N9H90_06600 [Pseudomonadales bacterium]|nr:hypothetical protein [Pseudomonadales bacterium]